MRNLFQSFAALLALTTVVTAQQPPRRICGADERYREIYQSSETFRALRGDLLQLTQAYAKVRSSTRIAARTGSITIPVVVHVVFREDAQNISDAQIKSQIDVLNRDFLAANPDRSGTPSVFQSALGNPRLQFRLAVRDPQGNATSGITRTKTNRSSFNYKGPEKDFIKFAAKGGHDAWPRDSYLNIWVGQLADSVLGYASFPGEPAEIDGVVIQYTAFGTSGTVTNPFDLGRTVTHEIGHWLNLFHIWGDDNGACSGSDQVDDTPNQGDATAGCPAFPQLSCKNQPNGGMFMNFMDYSNDACMFMFTAGQVVRMEAALAGPRLAVSSSNTIDRP